MKSPIHPARSSPSRSSIRPTTVEAPDYYRHMLGWNRKALRLNLPTNATPAQIKAAEALFLLAARKTGN